MTSCLGVYANRVRPTISGAVSSPPVSCESYLQTSFNWDTFFVLICVSFEYFVFSYEPLYTGQSVVWLRAGHGSTHAMARASFRYRGVETSGDLSARNLAPIASLAMLFEKQGRWNKVDH
jgi:hypothetical protein